MTTMWWVRAARTLVAGAMLATTAHLAFAQAQSRVVCSVVDEEGEPLPGVSFEVTTPRTALIRVSNRTDEDGRCTIPLIDATMIYDFVLTKEGFQRLEVTIKIPFGTTKQRFFLLAKAGSPQQSRILVSKDDLLGMRGGYPGVVEYNEAVEAELAGDLDAAFERVQDAVAANPELLAAQVRLASLALQLGDLPRAAEAAEHALQLDADCFEALHLRFEAYRKLGDEERTRQAAEALAAAGELADAAARIYNEAATAYNQGRVELARESFAQAIALEPEVPVHAYKALARIYSEEGQHAQAVAMAEEVLRRDPADRQALRIRYIGLRSLDVDAAATGEALRAVAAVDPELIAPDLYNHAIQLYNDQQVADARAAVEELLALWPDFGVAHYLLGLCLDVEGDRQAAKAEYERFLELDPDHPDAKTAREILEFLQ